MKVVMLTCEFRPFSGGIATYAVELARELHEAGVAVEVIAPSYPSGDDVPFEFPVHRLIGHHRFSLGQAWQVIRHLRAQRQGVIVHAVDIRAVLLAHLSHRLGGPAYRATIHGSEVSKFRGGRASKPLFAQAYLGAESILANSAATLALFHEAFGAAKDGRVTLLGVASDRFRVIDGPFDNPALEAIADHPLVCTVGRVEDRKGHFLALQALAQAQVLSGRRLQYVAAGPMVDPDYAARITAAARLADVDTLLPGPLTFDDMSRLFHRSICHLLPALAMTSKVEGFGLTIAEAAAQACPSICTRIGGIPEVIGTHGGGVVCEPGDAAGLARAVAAYATDPVARDEAGRRALLRARSLSWRRCARESYPEIAFPPDREAHDA